MFKYLVKDSYLAGITIGLFFFALAYFSFLNYEKMSDGWSAAIRLQLFPPRLQLIILASALLLFRFMIVKWNRVQTGKGLFLTLFISTIIYLFNFRNNFFE